MKTVSEICDKLTRKRLAAALGVKTTAVSNAAVQGKFPAKWYAVTKALAAEVGVECPDELFSFIAVDPPIIPTPPEKDVA